MGESVKKVQLKSKLSEYSKLIRLLTKQGYFELHGKEPNVKFFMTTKGMRALYILTQNAVHCAISWEYITKAALDPKFTRADVNQSAKDYVDAIENLTGALKRTL